MSIAAILLALGTLPSSASDNIAYAGGVEMVHGSGVFTVAKPVWLVAGVTCYILTLQDSGAVTSQTGWTQLATLATTTNGFPCTLLRRIADGTEPSTISVASGGSVGDCVLIGFTGVNATPEDATTTSGKGTAATITYPSITSVTGNDWHIAFCCNFNAIPGTPTGYAAEAKSTRWCATFAKKIVTPGVVSGVTSTGGGDWVAFSVLAKSS